MSMEYFSFSESTDYQNFSIFKVDFTLTPKRNMLILEQFPVHKSCSYWRFFSFKIYELQQEDLSMEFLFESSELR